MRKLSSIIAVITLALSLAPAPVVHADANCTATITPDSVAPGTEGTIDVTIQNTGDQVATWLQVQRPDLNYTVNGITQSGWTDATNDDGTTLTDSTLNPGDSFEFQLALFTGPQEEGAAPWNVQLASNSDGSDAVGCGGSVSTSITTPSSPPTPNGESNIHLTNITPTTATIAWDSDSASTSFVYYGIDTGYGSIATAPGSTVDHSVTLTGLQPSTIYHYEVAGSDDQGNTLFSSDNTFITPAAPPPPAPPIIINIGGGSSSPISAGANANVTGVIIQSNPTEHVPPTATLTTDFSKPFKQAPLITGLATDNVAVARVEYSIDGGKDWLPVDKVATQNVKGKSDPTKVNFQFTPILTEDGNYQIVARAIDSSANTGQSAAATLVIDRLPPQLGPLQVSSGPQVLSSAAQGTLAAVAGVNYRVTASAVGGPISMTIQATSVANAKQTQSFALTQSADTGLWNGVLSFKTNGGYSLTVQGLDGAGNRTNRQLLTVLVMPPGQVTGSHTDQPVGRGTVTVYYREPVSGDWQVWDSSPYDQTNPQALSASGHYSLMLPAGRYYLKVTAPGYHDFTSTMFTIQSPTPVAPQIKLTSNQWFALGPLSLSLPDVPWAAQALPAQTNWSLTSRSSLVGQTFPDFNLPTTAGGQTRALDLLRKPTDLVTLTTWSPASQAQLGPLQDAQTNTDVNVTPVFSQEHPQLVSVYLSTGGYHLNALVDADGVLVPSLGLNTLPQHVFVDRTGRVKKVMVGVLSKDEILSELGGL